MNVVILIGRLTDNPELRHTNTNIAVTRFSIAVDRGYKTNEERQADFINIVAWRNTAEFVSKYFVKGQMINVCGSLQTRTWDDAQGVKRYATEVIADEVNFCGDNRNGGAAPQEGAQTFSQAVDPNPMGSGFAPVDTDDDLPF